MNPFPELFELISFFESEPVAGGIGDQPIVFIISRGRERVEFEIRRSTSVLKLRWIQHNKPLINIELGMVKGLRIETRDGNEVMRATLISETPDVGRLFLFRWKPTIHVHLEIKRS